MTRMLTTGTVENHIGQSLGSSRWVTVTQEMINSFGALTMDEQWIHVDEGRAQRENGGAIAHGFLTLSLLSYMVADIWQFEGMTRAFNYGFNRLRFPASVAAGARVRLNETLVKVEQREDSIMLTREIAVEIEDHNKPAIAGEWVALLYLEKSMAQG